MVDHGDPGDLEQNRQELKQSLPGLTRRLYQSHISSEKEHTLLKGSLLWVHSSTVMGDR